MPTSPSALVGCEATAALLDTHPDVECIFFATDDLAIGGLFHCMQASVAVPERIGILQFNGIETGNAAPIRLTSVATPRFEVGRTAAEPLVASDERNAAVIDLGFSIAKGQTI